MKSPEFYQLSRAGSTALKKISANPELSSAWRDVVRNLAVETFKDHLSVKDYASFHGQVVSKIIGKTEFDFPVDIHAYRPPLHVGGKHTLLQADIHMGGAPDISFSAVGKLENFFNSPKNIASQEYRYKYIIGSVPNPFQKELWMNKFRLTRDGAGKSLNFHLPLNQSLDNLVVRLADGDFAAVEQHLAKSKYLKALNFFRKEGKYISLGEKYMVPLFRTLPALAITAAAGALVWLGLKSVSGQETRRSS